jgi:diacylglycerol kinase (ATP)
MAPNDRILRLRAVGDGWAVTTWAKHAYLAVRYPAARYQVGCAVTPADPRPSGPEPAGRGGRFSWTARLRSFGYAANGIGLMLRTQHNAWIHLAMTIAVCTAGGLFRLTGSDWRWITVAIAIVWIAEAINTAFEHLCDVVSPDFHPSVEKAKDIAAGAVLICACGAAMLGLLTFWPYVFG